MRFSGSLKGTSFRSPSSVSVPTQRTTLFGRPWQHINFLHAGVIGIDLELIRPRRYSKSLLEVYIQEESSAAKSYVKSYVNL